MIDALITTVSRILNLIIKGALVFIGVAIIAVIWLIWSGTSAATSFGDCQMKSIEHSIQSEKEALYLDACMVSHGYKVIKGCRDQVYYYRSSRCYVSNKAFWAE